MNYELGNCLIWNNKIDLPDIKQHFVQTYNSNRKTNRSKLNPVLTISNVNDKFYTHGVCK